MDPQPDLVLRRAVVPGRGLTDVHLADGRIAAMARELGAPSGAEVVDLDGRTLLPGLWDAHVHIDQWAMARDRLDLAAARSAAEVVTLVAERLAATGPPTDDQPLVGSGYRAALWPDRPHRDLLDPVTGDIPVVLASGDYHSCWLNSAAARRFGHPDHRTGVLVETEWFPVMEAIRAVPQDVLDRRVADAMAAAAARGIVGLVDLEAPCPLDAWVRRAAAHPLHVRVACGVWTSSLDAAIARGLRTGDVVPDTDGLVTMGPFKVIADGSLNTRTAACHDPYPDAPDHPHGIVNVEPDELAAHMTRATRHGIACAIHAIGDRAADLVLDAFAASGATGSVEHAQLLTRDAIPRLAALGLVASVQPAHALDDRDVADHLWAGRTDRAYAFADLHAAGVPLAFGSDAPVAPLDPWLAIAAAVHRTDDDRPPWHPEQALDLDVALAASARGRTSVAVGDPADLVVTDHDPHRATAAELRAMPVAGTLLAGRWTHRDGI